MEAYFRSHKAANRVALFAVVLMSAAFVAAFALTFSLLAAFVLGLIANVFVTLASLVAELMLLPCTVRSPPVAVPTRFLLPFFLEVTAAG